MHLLAAKPGGYVDDDGIVDLAQTPAPIVILAAADSTLAALAEVAEDSPAQFPSLRLANWLQLMKPAAFDLYEHKVLDHAWVVVVSLLGGASYWRYGYERLQHWAQGQTAAGEPRQLIVVPGDDTPDPELDAICTADPAQVRRVWRYLRESGRDNLCHLLQFLASEYFGDPGTWQEPRALPSCLLYLPGTAIGGAVSLDQWRLRWARQPSGETRPVCALLFYRSHLQAANTGVFDELVEVLERSGLNPLPIAVSSLKDPESLALANALIEQSGCRLIINTTGFASNTVTSPGPASEPTRFEPQFGSDVAVLQALLAGNTEQDWMQHSQGLRSRDMAMQVVLPEMDGRVITRAVSFKAESWYSDRCQSAVLRYALHAERAAFVSELAARYCALSSTANSVKRVALVLANYPTRDGRIGNGVGLDTPASVITILRALQQAGYPVDGIPDNGDALVAALLESVTNNPQTLQQLPCWQSLALDDYLTYFDKLPEPCRQAVLARWGGPERDPKCRRGRLMLAGIRLGDTFVGIQPARGFDRDLTATYHDPDLVPPHSYLAFYFWLRHCYRVDAVVHVGKHGNLEWLPGKGSALSSSCWPDIALGPMPHFYPFIVNDPGEGAQAKRRTQAVIIDHLMPPLARAETYGDLFELEQLVDEYYQALELDPRRERWLRDKIVALLRSSHVLEELGGGVDERDQEDLLARLDAYLCDIKEAQIRCGLHRLGELPSADKLTETLVALLRLPRGEDDHSQGLLHNIVRDLGLAHGDQLFDPLQQAVEPWAGACPAVLEDAASGSWRTTADTRERLELVARDWIAQHVVGDDSLQVLDDGFPRTAAQLRYARRCLLPALEQSARDEIGALLGGLAGRFVPPGPSGAPTRGRLDTLPTGRNFFSVDNRAIPSQAAWALGQQSADALIARHLQEHGDYPRRLGLSVWGTATMRTGGDDIAQAFALMGVVPVWAPGSQRVVDFEIVSTMLLGRPRVDVTLRVSGFFRDAFANVMRLFDAAVQALVTLEEPGDGNTVAEHVEARRLELMAAGVAPEQARAEAAYRVFGSKPGAYGAGLQGLIDERCWQQRDDLAAAYLNWGGYAYGQGRVDGVEARAAFEHQLSGLEVVLQNQDNREHDLLDSDDYYQFQGGMANAVAVLGGSEPVVYHGDHANPEAPRIRTLKEEINRVVRSRLLNPRWITAMREHGYKGAFEMAASVDYLFAYDATTRMVDDYQYQSVADALVFDTDNQRFMRQHNVNALEEMAERLLEATQRGLWEDAGDYGTRLQDLLLDIDQGREQA